jgi:hypothetical protein
MSRFRRLSYILVPIALGIGSAALAQTPPTPTELAAYRDLHAAAARGDVAEIRRLAAAGVR